VSQFLIAVPFRTKKVKEVAEAVYKDLYCQHGAVEVSPLITFIRPSISFSCTVALRLPPTTPNPTDKLKTQSDQSRTCFQATPITTKPTGTSAYPSSSPPTTPSSTPSPDIRLSSSFTGGEKTDGPMDGGSRWSTSRPDTRGIHFGIATSYVRSIGNCSGSKDVRGRTYPTASPPSQPRVQSDWTLEE
jgi:hypothetical protein